MPPIPSNYRRWSESDDLNFIEVTIENMPNSEQVVVFNLAGMQDLVDQATRQGFRPNLETWAEGLMRDYYEMAADEDDDQGERYAALSPAQRREFIKEQGRSLAVSLNTAVEFHEYEPIPDTREEE